MTIQQPETQEAWDEIAEGFDEHVTPMAMTLADQVFELVSLADGMHVLDVAAGSGALSIPAARRGAHVVATDLSGAMIARLEARANEEGLEKIEARVMDAHELDLDDEVFDLAVSSNGVSIIPEIQRALREMVRVTKPAGTVAVVNFGPPEQAEWLGVFVRAMKAIVPGFDGPPPTPAFRLADPGRMVRELEESGLKDVHVEAATWEMDLRSGRHLWNVLRFANPVAGSMLSDLTEGQQAGLVEALDEALREHGGSDGAVLTTEMAVGIGTKAGEGNGR